MAPFRIENSPTPKAGSSSFVGERLTYPVLKRRMPEKGDAMPRLEEFVTFCAVVEHCSFSNAAEHLGISQPAVSQQIKALEAAYGTPLLLRSSLGVTPTERGQEVYDYAVRIVGLYERSKRSLHDDEEDPTGTLSVGASTGVGEVVIPVALARFKKAHPNVRVNLHVADSEEILDRVVRDRIEIGFVGAKRRDRHLQFEPFITDRLVLAFSPTHPLARRATLSIEELTELPLVLQQPGSGATQALRRALGQSGIPPDRLNILAEVGLQESTKHTVMTGLGGTVISRLGVAEELRDRRLVEVPIEGLDLTHEFYVVTRSLWPMSRVGRNFLTLAHAAVEEALRAG